MGKRAVAAVAGEMWEPAFGAGFQAPRANQESQVSYSSRPPAPRHFASKAANSAHFLRNRIFGLPDGLKSSFSRKPPKLPPSSDSCAVPKKHFSLPERQEYFFDIPPPAPVATFVLQRLDRLSRYGAAREAAE